MDDKQETIGLSDLLSEVDLDLEDFRKKHSGDYSVKNVTLWWELEKERLLARHMPLSVVKKLRRVQTMKRVMIWFFAGAMTMTGISAVVRLLIP